MHNREKLMEADKTPVMGYHDHTLPVVTEIVDPDITRIMLESVSARSYYLEYTGKEQIIPITKFPFTIGRSESSNLNLNNKTVSRLHATLKYENHMVIIESIGGLNGIYVNGHCIKRVILTPGDSISIGEIDLVFHARQGSNPADVSSEYKASAIRTIDSVAINSFDGIDVALPDTPSRIDSLSDIMDIEPVGTGRMKSIFWIVLVVLVAAVGSIWYYQYNIENRVFILSENAPSVEGNIEKPGNTHGDNRDTRATKRLDTAQKQNMSAALASQAIATSELVKPGLNESTNAKPLGNVSTAPIRSTRQLILFEEKQSQDLIGQAKTRYLQGNIEEARNLLQEMIHSTRHRAEYRQQATELAKRLNALYANYANGNRYFSSSNKDAAFQSWIEMLQSERLLFADMKSVYSQRVIDIVVREYEKRGNEAYSQDLWQEAYRNWRAAVEIKPTSQARVSIESMDAELQELFRTGYRYETVNIENAIGFWRKVIEKAPEDHEYYIKAMAKLRWYEHLAKD